MADIAKIIALANGHIAPATGMEIHFLKVLAGEALPCSLEESEWVEIFRAQKNEGMKPEVDPSIARWRMEIDDLRNQLDISRNAIEDLKAANRSLTAMAAENRQLKDEIAVLNGYLAACHKTIQKYEPLPHPTYIDHEAEAARARLRQSDIPNAFVVYSATDGQE